jgi:hypothetical protein
MLILGRLVELTEGAFERKMRENRKKSGFGQFLENPREVEKTFVWLENKNKRFIRLFDKKH